MLRDPTERAPGKVRTLDPQTSHDAALANAPRFGTQRYHALAALYAAWPGSVTVAEITERIGMRSRNQVSTRVMELREHGWAERVIEPRTNAWLTKPTGPSAEGVLHRITEAGRRQFPTIRRPVVIHVDRLRLRTLLNEAPVEVKRAVAAQALDGKPPLTDTGYDDDAQLLYDVTIAAVVAAQSVGYALPFPVDTEPYRERLLALPDDLIDVVQTEGRTFRLPNLAHASLWTPEQAEQVDAIMRDSEDTAEVRLKRVHALLGEVSMNTDDVRHAIVSQLTGGRADSSKKLTAPEVDALDGWTQAIKADRVDWSSPARKLVDQRSGEVLPSYQCDWRSFAKAKGLPLPHLNKLARGAAERLNLPVPTKATDVTDHRLTAAVWRLVEAEAAMGRLSDAGVAAKPVDEAEEPQPPEALRGPEASAGYGDSRQAPSAPPEALQGPLMAAEHDLEPVVMVPVPAGRLRAVLDALGW